MIGYYTIIVKSQINMHFILLGAPIADAILSKIAQVGLDMKLCVGQAYDGAANMSGATRGAATIITNDYPMAVYTHCKAHILNLSLVKACKSVTPISKLF